MFACHICIHANSDGIKRSFFYLWRYQSQTSRSMLLCVVSSIFLTKFVNLLISHDERREWIKWLRVLDGHNCFVHWYGSTCTKVVRVGRRTIFVQFNVLSLLNFVSHFGSVADDDAIVVGLLLALFYIVSHDCNRRC